jgi:hypothetical protein
LKFKIKKLLLTSFLVFAGIFFAGLACAQSDVKSFNVNVNVFAEVSCNSNGICEPSLGENELNCFNDCGCNNNGTCESQRGEDASNCPGDCYAVPAGGYVSEFKLYIKNLKIENITFGSASFSWQTNKPAFCKIYLGRTSSYEKEIISETEFLTNHYFNFSNLLPSTVYHFNIVCQDSFGISAETGDKYFTTLYVIENVNNFTATPGENEIYLSWENPLTENFELTRIVKNENFYPTGIDDGQILYEGTGEFFEDKNVEVGKIYYYAAFVKGKNKSWSSGALAFSQNKKGEIPAEPVIPGVGILKLSDFDFYSDGIKIPVIDEKTVNPEANRQLIISIDYEKIPSAYKKIFIELDTLNNKFYYLFTPNRDKAVYSVSLVSPFLAGKYPIKINFLNEENKIISELNGELAVWFSQIEKPGSWIMIWLRNNITTVALLIILILLLILLFILEKRRRRNKKAK